MVDDPRRRDAVRESERERARLIRRATLYTVGFFAAAVVIAVTGSALIAWVLSRFGAPFRATWIAFTVIVLGVPLIVGAIGALRRRGGG